MVDYKLKDGVKFQELIDLGFYNNYSYYDGNYYAKTLSQSTCIIVDTASRKVQKWKSYSRRDTFTLLGEELPVTERTLKKAGLIGKVER